MESMVANPINVALSDYYHSFRHSQGSIELQKEIFRHMADFEAARDVDLYDTIKSEAFKAKLSKLPLPARHVPFDATAVLEAYETTVQDISKSMHQAMQPDCRVLNANIITRDRKYQDHIREHSPSDPHKSYFRQHVILGRTTDSLAMDYVYEQSADTWSRPEENSESYSTADRLFLLVKAWERNHSGELFYPIEVI